MSLPSSRLARRLILTLIVAAAATVRLTAAERIPFGDMTLVVEPNGALAFERDGQLAARLVPGGYAPGWVRRDADHAREPDLVRADGGLTATGRIPVGEAALRYRLELSRADDAVVVAVRVEPEGDLVLEDGQPPMLSLWLPSASVAGVEARFAGKVAQLPMDNRHAWGGDLQLAALGLALRARQPVAQSWWDHAASDRVEWRCKLPQVAGGWALELELHPGALPVRAEPDERAELRPATPSSATAAKLAAYTRLLRYPAAEGVDAGPARVRLARAAERIAAGEDDDGAIADTERWIEAHARLVEQTGIVAELRDAAAILGQTLPPELGTAAAAAAAGLDGDGAAAAAFDAAIAAAREGLGVGAAGEVRNAAGWIKAPAIHRLDAPISPWQVRWEDGIELAVTDAPAPWDGAASAGTTVSSTWVTTRFHARQQLTTSVLSPMIAIDGGETLRLRGVAPTGLRLPGAEGLVAHGLEGVPDMAENWLLLEAEGLHLLVVLGSPVVAIESMADGIDLRCEGGLVARLMRLDDVAEAELTATARLWSRIALALPVAAIESRDGDRVTYRYGYQRHADAWGTEPLELAPVPGLARIAGLEPLAGERVDLGLADRHGRATAIAGDRLSLPALQATLPMERGINVRMTVTAEALADVRARGASWVRLVVGGGWDGEAEAVAAVRAKLALCREAGVKVLLDPHDFLFHVGSWTDTMPRDAEAVARFTHLWDVLSRIGADFPETVVGYDLYNELKVRGDWAGWAEMATHGIAAIRANDPSTRIYMTGLVMANPEGFRLAEPLARDDVTYSFHFYKPHSFTHQKIQARSRSAPYTFYPGWLPAMDWAGGTHYGPGAMRFWDRWTLGAAMLPVLEFGARHRVRMHCGEFSVIGYSRDQAQASAARWTADAIGWFERQQYPWQLWNQGFGLLVPEVVPVVEAGWALGAVD